MKQFKQLPGRRDFLKNATALSFSGLSLQAATLSTVPIQDNTQGKVKGSEAGPVLASVGSENAEIIIAPVDLSTGWVEYGNTPQLGLRVDFSENGMFFTSDQVLRFDLAGLKPGTTYYYKVCLRKVIYYDDYKHEQGEQKSSEILSFRTLDINAEVANFACWNDTHENQETLDKLTGLLKKQQPDFLVWNGDITNNILDENKIVEQFLKPAEAVSSLGIPLMLSRGNHDVRGRDARCLKHYFSGPGRSFYYGFRQGPLSCIVLDTGEDKPDDHASYAGLLDFADFRKEQAQWLEKVVDEPWFNEAPFRVVFMHIPLVWDAEVPEKWPYIWGVEGHKGWVCEDGYAKWHNLLVQAKVQLVISGHTHRHAYFPPNGVHPYGQLIGGGPRPDSATSIFGQVTNDLLKLTMTGLEGKVLEDLEIFP